MCVDVALDAARMLRDGATLTEIRHAVESRYGAEYPFKTDTPKPRETAQPVTGKKGR